MHAEVAIIGGGAAGLAAGVYSANAGAKTLLLEKNEKLGRKLYITGKGRCNLTNDAALDEFMREVPRNGKFLYSALHWMGPQDTKRLVEAHGCPVKTERGRRVFPVSDKASDVTKAWTRALDEAGTEVRLNAEVFSLDEAPDGGYILSTTQGMCRADTVVIATGGLSYPSTGSTGDGYRFAARLGVPVTECVPSLIPLRTGDSWTGTLQGLSLKNVTLTAMIGKRTLYRNLGELMFTHDGISGPLAIELSSHLNFPLPADLAVWIDLKPGLSEEQLHQRIVRDIGDAGKKAMRTLMEGLLPRRLAELVLKLLKMDPAMPANQLSAPNRDALVRCLKRFSVHVSGTHPIAEAVVTRGGVDVRALNPATMALRTHPRVFFCGEVIDVDAHTGGYNLQIAFSTGALAGYHAALTALSLEKKES